MTRFEKALQLWSVLAYCAHQRQTISYNLLSGAVGVPRTGLGRLLEPIQSYCILNRLPPLTSLVVRARDGLPTDGFVAAQSLPQAQAEAFAFPWLERPVPTPEDLIAAVEELPSLGLSLSELMKDIHPKDCQ
jgi:putative restriction endonuclease